MRMLRFAPLLLVIGVAFSSVEHDLAKAPQARIINGRAAQKDRFPWFVRTIGKASNNGEFRACGGSLIAPDLIVTAAHCEAPETVQVGAYDTTKIDKSLERKVVQSVRHPSYPQGLTVNFDIMISKLESPVTDIQPIKMNFDDNYPSASGARLKIMGFGSTMPGPDAPVDQSQVLQIAPTGYVPFRECAVAEDPETGNKYGSSPSSTVVEDWWLCTLYTDPRVTGSCFGDSGGPVFRQGKNLGTDLLVGVISGASGYCGNPNLPLWNNRVSYFEDWFTSTGCAMSSDPPAYWNCGRGGGGGGGGGRGGGGGDGDSNIGIIVAVALGVVVIAALIIFLWRRSKRSATTPNVVKGKLFDEEQPRPSGDRNNNVRERIATEPSSPASSDASLRKEPLKDGSSQPPRKLSGIFGWSSDSNDTEKQPPRKPSGIFDRRPSSDSNGNDKPPPRKPSGILDRRPSSASNGTERPPPRKPSGMFDRRPSTEASKQTEAPREETKSPLARRPSGLFNKRTSTETIEEKKPASFSGRKMSMDGSKPEEDKEPGFFDRKLSLDNMPGMDSLPGWLTTKPAFLKSGDKKDDDSDDDSFLPPEIADMVNQIDKELDSAVDDSRSKRGRRSSDPVKCTQERSRSVDRRRASDFADRRGRGQSRDDARRRSSRSTERLDPSSDGRKRSSSSDNRRGRGQSREPASRRPSRSRERTQPSRRSSSSDNPRKPRSRSKSAEPKPRSSSVVAKPRSFSALASKTSRPARTGPKQTQQPRSRSDTVPGTSKRFSGDSFTRTPVSRTKSDSVAAPSKPTPSRQERPKAAPRDIPTPRANSDTARPSSRPTHSGSERNQAREPTRIPPLRTKSDSVKPPARQPNPTTSSPKRSSAPETSYKNVFDQWKQREETAKPVVTKNADGTVTVTKSRRNAEGVKVITKTNYASLNLARRHGIDI